MKLAHIAITLFALCGAVHAADVDPNLPPDTEVVVSVNLDSLLASPLGKRYLATTVTESIKSNAQLADALKTLELEPLRDLTRVTIAMSSAGAESGFVIVNGKFNRAKITELAAKIAGESKDRLKTHKAGDKVIYEIAGDKPAFVMLTSDTTLLISTDREQLTKTGKPKKEMADLIAKADGKQAGWIAALGNATAALPVTSDAERKVFEKVEGILGVLKVQTSAKLELTLVAADAATATAVTKILEDFISVAKVFGRDATKQDPALAPLVDLLGGVTVSAKDKLVTLTAEMSAAQIEKAVKNLGADK
jgi:hypothetical protein